VTLLSCEWNPRRVLHDKRLTTDTQQLRARLVQLAQGVALVVNEVAHCRERAAATYRRMAQTHPTRSEYYLQRAAELDTLAARARTFADRETREALGGGSGAARAPAGGAPSGRAAGSRCAES
jgi:hypothetical protein